LFLPVRAGFPLEAEVHRILPGARLLVADATLRELDHLVERHTPHAAAARDYSTRFVLVASKGDGDDAVVEVALRKRAFVVTADQELQARLRRQGVSVLAPRDRHRLELQPALADTHASALAKPRRARISPRRAPPRGNG
jgi:rRNA-processing protein FCF1